MKVRSLQIFLNSNINSKSLIQMIVFMEVSSESPRVPPRDRMGDLPVFCARGVGYLPFIFARG